MGGGAAGSSHCVTCRHYHWAQHRGFGAGDVAYRLDQRILAAHLVAVKVNLTLEPYFTVCLGHQRKPLPLSSTPAPVQNLLQMADSMGREQEHFARDLVNRIFPHSSIAISARDVAGVKRCLSDWIFAIEYALGQGDIEPVKGGSVFPQTWATLTASGLLSDEMLVQEARMRMLLWQFAQPSGAMGGTAIHAAPQYLSELAGSENPLLADAAMRLISAILRDKSNAPGQLVELPVELLHLLVWRVIAAYEVIRPGRHVELQAKVPAILIAHDEGQAHGRSAQYLAHKLMELNLVDAQRPALAPAKQGLALSLALLALASGLSFVQLAQMAMEPGLARMCVVLRALRYDEQAAGTVMGWIVGRLGHENAAVSALSRYESATIDGAMAMVTQWRAARPNGDAAQ